MMGLKKRVFFYWKIFKELLYHLKFLPEKIRNRYGNKRRYLASLKKIESYE